MSNFRWPFKKKIYDWLLEHEQIPLHPAHERYGGMEYNGRNYMSPWRMYQRNDFQTLQRRLLAKLKAEGRIKVQYI